MAINLKKIRNIRFYSWILLSLIRIHGIGKKIDKYRAIGDTENERKQILKASSWWGPSIVKAFKAEIRAEGLDRIPSEPALFVSNHQAYGDIFVFLAMFKSRQIGFIAKKSLAEIPLFGAWIRRVRSIFITQNNPRASVASFKLAEEYLRDGFSLVVFPEGTRHLSDGMGAFKKGSMRPAFRTGVPIVPVTIRGAWHFFEERGYVCPHAIDFYIHSPIETKPLTNEEMAGLSERVEKIVRDKLDEWNGNKI